MGRQPGRISPGRSRAAEASSGLKVSTTDTLRILSCNVASRMENCSPRVRHGSSRAVASSSPCRLASHTRSNSASVCDTLATPPRTASSSIAARWEFVRLCGCASIDSDRAAVRLRFDRRLGKRARRVGLLLNCLSRFSPAGVLLFRPLLLLRGTYRPAV
jgi:hypothetical protein